MNITVREMTAEDWEGVRAVYLEGIASGNATFETSAPSWTAWDANHLANPRLIASANQQLVGWAVLSPVSSRCAYSGVAEVSVYVTAWARHQGVGKALLSTLIERSEQAGLWTLQTGIFPENTASLTLHESCGFRVVGRRERLGKLHGVWRDVIFLERRSPTAEHA
jgi:L-amino acid N-acyltransferase YncA